MATLGDLERSVLEHLWASEDSLSAYDLQDRLAAAADAKPLAATTILTVLSRLEKKGFVVRERSSRPHRYRSTASREDHMAELMHDALGSATDRIAVLERFVDRATPEEAEALRRLLLGG